MLGVFASKSVIPMLVTLLFPVFDPSKIALIRLRQAAAVVSVPFFAKAAIPCRTFNGIGGKLIGGLRMSQNWVALSVFDECIESAQRWRVGRPPWNTSC